MLFLHYIGVILNIIVNMDYLLEFQVPVILHSQIIVKPLSKSSLTFKLTFT